MKRSILPVTIFCCTLLLAACGKSKINKFSFDVYPDCTTPTKYSSNDVDVSYPSTGFIISGNTGTDEIGIYFYGTPVEGVTYDLGATSPFNVDVYWDPGDNGVEEYGSLSGQAKVIDFQVVDNVVQRVEITFDNISAINPGGNTICIKSGYILFDRD